MNLPTDEVVDRLEQGMENLEHSNGIWIDIIEPLTNWITSNPVRNIGIILILATITTFLIKSKK